MFKKNTRITERRTSKNYKDIFVTDIDETLLHSNFDSLGCTKWPDKQIQYSTITNGTPNLPILKIMDEYINKGYDVAFLTARSSYQTTARALKKFLMYRDVNGDLQPIEDVLEDDFSFAVNDNEQRSYIASSTPARKAEVVADLCEIYDNVVFADDSDQNLALVKKLLKVYNNLTVIDAKTENRNNKDMIKKINESSVNYDCINNIESTVDWIIGHCEIIQTEDNNWKVNYDNDLTGVFDEDPIDFNGIDINTLAKELEGGFKRLFRCDATCKIKVERDTKILYVTLTTKKVKIFLDVTFEEDLTKDDLFWPYEFNIEIQGYADPITVQDILR